MGGIIRAAHLARNTSRLKDRIIDVLSEKYPLNARKIHQQIICNHNISVSYQRIHKLLRELVEYGVLKELEREYLINTEWLDQIVDLGRRIKQNYLNRPDVATDCDPDATVFDNSYSVLECYKRLLATQIENETKDIPFLNAVPMTSDRLNVRQQAGKAVNAVHVLLTRNHSLLLGNSGSGKTTTLRMLALQAAKENKQIPILVKLSEYQGENLPRLINQSIKNIAGQNISESLVSALINEGSFKILFDGLNEANGKVRVNKALQDRKDVILNRINTLLKDDNYSKNGIIVSCRTHDDPKDRLHLPAFSLLPLTESMMDYFLSQNETKGLLAQLKKNRKLFMLCRNPFALSMIRRCRLRGDIDLNKRSDIYKLFVDEFLYGWESKHIGSNKEAVVTDMLSILSELAYQMNMAGVSMEYLRAHQIMETTANDLRLEKQYFNQILHHILHANIIQKNGNKCLFMHQSLQEYLAAIAIKRKGITTDELDQKIKDKRWHETLIFYASMADDPQGLVLSVHDFFTSSCDHTYLFLSAKCASEAELTTPEVLDPVLSSLFKIYTYPDDDFYLHWFDLHNVFNSWRCRAVTKRLIDFFDMCGDEISPRIVNLLHHSDDVLYTQRKGMGRLQNIIFRKSTNKHLLYSAIEVMALIKNTDIIPSLIRFISDEDTILRAQSAWALKEIGEDALEKVRKKKRVKDPLSLLNSIQKESVTKLVNLIENKGEEPFIRGHAMIELCKADYRRAVPYILRLLEEDSPIIRYHAMYMVPNLPDDEASFMLNHMHKKEAEREEYNKIVSSITKGTMEVPTNGGKP